MNSEVEFGDITVVNVCDCDECKGKKARGELKPVVFLADNSIGHENEQ